MILSDREIRQRCEQEELLSPFEPSLIREVDLTRVLSFGTSSAGYDLRLSPDEFRIFTPTHATEIDPKNFDEDCLVGAPLRRAHDGSWYFLLPPHTYGLGITVEHFTMPCDLMAIIIGKSTYARSGLIVNATPAEPGWSGKLVLEFANTAPLPIRIYANEGIAQTVFARLSSEPLTTYADRNGKYQNQQSLVLARV